MATYSDSQSLVIELIDELYAADNSMSFQYAFDALSNQHIIDVAPSRVFKEAEYMLAEVKATKKFISNFPDEGILFVSNDPYIKVENPVYKVGSNADGQLLFAAQNI
ncbi:hypothetical protein [Dyadobacter sandarakinus]|uniref:Uncharacterized protein n=1 Tax=Dyadobacter sandarakinus TaxID=2747268 RepID=A0ABX7IAD6_9BACT|nr:hypothetical protein [Dyadobacter sandarakinus]QRR02412.1 hypothetical protein HWI92_16590 [Dyadobacter sandarakinus]